jgi:hypothetical protein
MDCQIFIRWGDREETGMLALPLGRRHPRFPVHKIVSYRFREKCLLTLTLDIGLGGMKVKTHTCIPEGERLEFKLLLGVDSICSEGRVAYSRLLANSESVSGVAFTGLSERDHDLLRDCVETLEKWPEPGAMISTDERRDTGPDIFKLVE